jgi:hypothetical protein
MRARRRAATPMLRRNHGVASSIQNSQAQRAPLFAAGQLCHATGSRLVPWRQPGGWGMKSLTASTAPFRPEPDWSCERAFRERAAPAWQAVEGLAAGPATQSVSARDDLPPWQCHGRYCRHGACHGRPRVTDPGHGGHGAGHGATHGFHGAGHSDHCDEERPAGRVSAAVSAAGAAAFTRAGRAAGGTKSTGVKRTHARAMRSFVPTINAESIAPLHGREQAF